MCSGFLPLGFFVRATAEPGHFWDEIGSWFLLHSLVLPATTSGSPSLFGCSEWRCLGWKIFCYSWSCFSCSDRISESENHNGQDGSSAKVGSCSRAVWPLIHRWGSRGAESFLQVIGFCDVNDLFSLEAESYLLEFWVFWTELRAISQDDLKEKAKVAGEEDSVQKLDRWLLLCGGIHSKHSVGGPEMRRAFVLFDSFPLLKKRCLNIPFFTTKLFIYRAKARACHLTKIQGWNANLFLLNLIWVDFSEFFTFSVWVTSFCFGERWICDEIQLWVVVVCLFLNHGCHLAATTKNMEKMQMISRRQGCDCSPRLWPWLWRRGFGRVRG